MEQLVDHNKHAPKGERVVWVKEECMGGEISEVMGIGTRLKQSHIAININLYLILSNDGSHQSYFFLGRPRPDFLGGGAAIRRTQPALKVPLSHAAKISNASWLERSAPKLECGSRYVRYREISPL